MVKKNYKPLDRITKKQAQKKFNEYYENKKYKGKTSKKKIKNAKLQDMRYSKPIDKVLKEGEPGSARYLHNNGPRTFDFEGVDAFKEGEKFILDLDKQKIINNGEKIYFIKIDLKILNLMLKKDGQIVMIL